MAGLPGESQLTSSFKVTERELDLAGKDLVAKEVAKVMEMCRGAAGQSGAEPIEWTVHVVCLVEQGALMALKLHYFDDEKPDPNDIMLKMAVGQGYVPVNCLLNGTIVMDEMNNGRDPCAGCEGPREKCGGRPRRRDRQSAKEVPRC